MNTHARRPRPTFVRDADGGAHAERFLVSAVATVLLIRAFLAATGYPQLGGGRLHIAHMLWGGLAMGVALLAALLSLNRQAKPFAAVAGGIGFGFFIDELGKFVTRDYDYFYQPAVALIYIVFVCFFLSLRLVFNRSPLSDDERLANALTIMKDMAIEDLDENEKAQATALLDRCDPKDPRVALLRGFLDRLAVVAAPAPNAYQRARLWIIARADRLITRPLFPSMVTGVFIAQAIAGVIWAVGTARVLWTLYREPMAQRHLDVGFMEWATIASTLLSALLVWYGAACLLRSRARAYVAYRRALLVAVFLTQFFVFYDSQLLGLVGLSVNLVQLGAVRYLLSRELEPGVVRAG
jgi:hypothetical protein